MKTFLYVICLFILSVGPAQLSSRATPSRSYVLKAWHIDGDSAPLFWSLEEAPTGDSPGTLEQSPGTLYKSLAETALRARIDLFPAGTKLKFRGSVRGGVGLSAEEDKDWQLFVAFCNSRHIDFDFFINTD